MSSSTESRTHDIDVAIIGAGAAGIAAGRRLRAAGLSCRLLEARTRIGGRAWTETDSLGLPLDRGCAWFHQGSINPLRALADELGIGYGGNMQLQYYLGKRLVDPGRVREITEFLEANIERVVAAGRRGLDVAAAEVIEREHPWQPLLDQLLAAINGVDPAEYSSAEAAAEIELDENWICREGLGTLITRLGQGLPVSTACAVRRVQRTPSGVRLATTQGELSARAVIVTASVGVLAAGAIEFDPPLPDWKLTALERVPMGLAEKIALRFDGDVFGLPENTFLQIEHAGSVLGFHIAPFARPVAIAYAGGARAREIAAMSGEAAAAFALEHLTSAFGSEPGLRLQRHTHTQWAGDTWSLGSYSAARPGHHAQRAELARPLERIHFAGEATISTSFATAHGAWQSGERAAAAVTAELAPGG